MVTPTEVDAPARRLCAIVYAAVSTSEEDNDGDGAYDLHDMVGTPNDVGHAIADCLANSDMMQGRHMLIESGADLYLHVKIKFCAPTAVEEEKEPMAEPNRTSPSLGFDHPFFTNKPALQSLKLNQNPHPECVRACLMELCHELMCLSERPVDSNRWTIFNVEVESDQFVAKAFHPGTGATVIGTGFSGAEARQDRRLRICRWEESQRDLQKLDVELKKVDPVHIVDNQPPAEKRYLIFVYGTWLVGKVWLFNSMSAYIGQSDNSKIRLEVDEIKEMYELPSRP